VIKGGKGDVREGKINIAFYLMVHFLITIGRNIENKQFAYFHHHLFKRNSLHSKENSVLVYRSPGSKREYNPFTLERVFGFPWLL
jgi:hypothetical protein